MRADDASDSGHSDMSPEVERFLMPRETPCLGAAVLSATMAGAVASLAGAVVLAYSQRSGLGESVLAAKVIALRLSGNATAVDSSPGLAAIFLVSMACGVVGGALFGVVVAKLIGKVGIVTALGVGVTYGLLVWSVGQFVVLASFVPNAVALGNQHVLITAHIVYGALLGLLSGWSREPQPRATTFSLRRHWG